jgi:hypothetical protein
MESLMMQHLNSRYIHHEAGTLTLADKRRNGFSTFAR